MIAIVRTRTMRALRASLATTQTEAEAASALAERYRQDAETATASAIRAETALEELRAAHARSIAEAARAEGELTALRAQTLLDTEDRAVLRMLLRQARKAAAPRHVYVLLRRGTFHSLHETREAAETAAEREGAPRDGWFTQGGPGTPSPAVDVLWRIQPVPLTGGS
ncbi:hypothetical protein QR97_16790 [Streptomyces sp. PBH53]|uniref:hypothetical protein n=1 Tax=Streptomyces sp. PBH53 TaxID=1577075 RepID=UPI000655CF98|nr:hypothetical protein [Streptomyces sp. PBH53]AKN71240.1 hypothetical protein QR97_16790 [Streptomyces sp. PBH53]